MFDVTNVTSRANSDVLTIERIIEARHTPGPEQMAEIVRIAEAYKRSLEAVGFGYMLKVG